MANNTVLPDLFNAVITQVDTVANNFGNNVTGGVEHYWLKIDF